MPQTWDVYVFDILPERHALALTRRDRTAEERTCVCGATFELTVGERNFAAGAGLPLPTRCRRCRPSRRQAIAKGLIR